VCAAVAFLLTQRVLRSYSAEAADPRAAFSWALLAAVWCAFLFLYGRYTLRLRQPWYLAVSQVLKAVVIGTSAALAVSYLLVPSWLAGRPVYLLSGSFFFVLASASRIAARVLMPRRVFSERYLLVGGGKSAEAMIEAIGDGHAPIAAELVGLVAASPGDLPSFSDDSPASVLGDLEDLPDLIEDHDITHLVLCGESPPAKAVMRAVAESEAAGVKVQTMPSAYEALTRRAPLRSADGEWIASLETARRTKYATRLKRIVEMVVSLLVLPFVAVVVALAAIAVKLTSRGPAFYTQKRVGADGKEFTFVKLRTMIQDAEKDTGPVWATPNDPRITPLGKTLRRLRLDELPQLWSVLKGEMSLVGPRPERPHFVEQFREEIPLYEKRFLVRPGITGWAQVNHAYDTCRDDVIEKLRYDLYYVRHMNFSLDLQIMVRTLGVMLANKGGY